MTVIHLGNQRYEGATADTKPTNVPVGSIYRDTQTDEIYEFNGTTWDVIIGPSKAETLTTKGLNAITNTVKNIGSYTYTIFKDGSTYYCRNNLTGAIEVSDASPNTVLGYPFTVGGSAYVMDGAYTLTEGPTVYFDFPPEATYLHFYMSPEANITVPNGFTGTVFRFKNSATNHCAQHVLSGGYLNEAGATKVQAWTGVLFEGSGNASRGVFDNTVELMRIWNADHAIKFNCDATATSGFITTNWIQNMMLYRCKTAFIGFTMQTAYISGTNGSSRNTFLNVLIQGGDSTATVTGVKDVWGRHNIFINTYVADFDGSNGPRSTIHANATDTLIIGGSMDTKVVTTDWVDGSSNKSTIRISETAAIATKSITLPSVASSNITTPQSGYVAVFLNSATGVMSTKNSSGTVSPI